MGILKSGILGPIVNKTGPSIGRRHMGRNVVTSLYRKSTKAATEEQLDAQLKFGLLSSFLNSIAKLVDIGFNQYAKGRSAVNAAFSYNFEHAFVKIDEKYQINYQQMVYSRGHIATPEGTQAIPGAGNIIFSWLPQSQSAYCQFTDRASFMLYNTSKNKPLVILAVTERHQLGCTIEIPVDYAGDTLHCYMSFDSANGKLSGDSVYVGEVVAL